MFGIHKDDDAGRNPRSALLRKPRSPGRKGDLPLRRRALRTEVTVHPGRSRRRVTPPSRLRLRAGRRKRDARRVDLALEQELQGAPAGVLLASLAHATLAWGRGTAKTAQTISLLEELQTRAHQGVWKEESSDCPTPGAENPALLRLAGLAPGTVQTGAALAHRALQAGRFRRPRRAMMAVVAALAIAYNGRLGDEKLTEAFLGLDEAAVLLGGRTRLQSRLLSAMAEANDITLR